MNSVILSCRNLSKHFGKISVLNSVSLEIKQGEIFGLLGPNGAGKTTFIRCLLGLLKVNAGEFDFKGRRLDTKDILKDFGFLPENFLPPRNLKAVEFIKILNWGLNLKPKNAEYLLELVGLKEYQNKYIKTYSRGMVQRLGLAVCLLKGPEVIILDEPAAGLDPIGQRDALNILSRLRREGKTIFFSSHILSQIEKICTRIGIIHRGAVKFTGTAEEIKKKHNVSFLEEAFLKEIEEERE